MLGYYMVARETRELKIEVYERSQSLVGYSHVTEMTLPKKVDKSLQTRIFNRTT